MYSLNSIGHAYFTDKQYEIERDNMSCSKSQNAG